MYSLYLIAPSTVHSSVKDVGTPKGARSSKTNPRSRHDDTAVQSDRRHRGAVAQAPMVSKVSNIKDAL